MSIQRKQFVAGQQVKIVQGGWGVHPEHIGEVVTIREAFWGTSYSLVEDLGKGKPTFQSGPAMRADSRSFEAYTGEGVADQIRAINQQIKDVGTRIAHFQEQINTQEAAKEKLVRQRQVLVATLLRELDV